MSRHEPSRMHAHTQARHIYTRARTHTHTHTYLQRQCGLGRVLLSILQKRADGFGVQLLAPPLGHALSIVFKLLC